MSLSGFTVIFPVLSCLLWHCILLLLCCRLCYLYCYLNKMHQILPCAVPHSSYYIFPDIKCLFKLNVTYLLNTLSFPTTRLYHTVSSESYTLKNEFPAPACVCVSCTVICIHPAETVGAILLSETRVGVCGVVWGWFTPTHTLISVPRGTMQPNRRLSGRLVIDWIVRIQIFIPGALYVRYSFQQTHRH